MRTELLRTPPRNYPWIRPTCGSRRFTTKKKPRYQNDSRGILKDGREKKWVTAEEEETHRLLILFFSSFFPTAFACERFLDTLFFAGLQVKGVALNLLDDVFLLHLTLKTSQRVFEGFPLLKSDFRQLTTPPNSSRWTQ